VEEKMVKIGIYTKTFILTLGIFLIGLFIGMTIESSNTANLIDQTSGIESSVQEIELEMLYFQSLNDSYSCQFLNETVRKTNNNLDDLAKQLSGFSEDRTIVTSQDMESLKKRYTSLLIKDWLLQQKIKQDCGTGIVSTLYFYDRKGCDDCIIQGDILSILKDLFKEKLMIFPLDRNVESYMVDILIKRFNITSVPSVVIENRVYSGVVTKDSLKTLVCDNLPKNTEQCSAI
jgi:hypothetical protein